MMIHTRSACVFGMCLVLVLGSRAVYGRPEPPTSPNRPVEHKEVPEGEPTSIERAGRATSAAGTVTRGRFVSTQVNVDFQGNNIVGDAANEPSIAVDPTQPDRMAIGWREFSSVTSAFRQAGYAYSQDGGQTWTFPGVLTPGVFRSDPVLNSDAEGNFFYNSLSTVTSAEMFKSTDGGVTWSAPIAAFGGDKAWFTIDRTNGIGRGNIYIAWSSGASAGCCFPATFTRSVDGGLTYMQPIEIPGRPFSGTLAVGPDGAVYVVGIPNPSPGGPYMVARSVDAQNPAVTPTFDLLTIVDLDGARSFGDTPNPGGLLGQSYVDVDHSGGPTHNNIYVLSSVRRFSVNDPLDVMFARSEDGGWTYSPPVRVNDDTPGNGAWQWFGAMSVAPNGRIDVTWNDTRNDPSGTVSELYYSFSLDGGRTWSAGEPVSPSFNSLLGFPVQQKIGDYNDMVSDNGGAYVAYAATFNGEEDVYFVRVTPDCNTNGVADASDIASMTSLDCNDNLIPDECEPNEDCNGNLEQDICDVVTISSDCNHNFIPDECEPDEDCNGNTQRDICETAANPSIDCDRNGVPDECDVAVTDCNGTGIVDECDIKFRTSEDCNENSVPDECDIASGTSDDNDNDGIPDECVGACCLCEICVDTTEPDCAAQNGLFFGAGVPCNDITCPVLTNDACTSAEALPSQTDWTLPYDNRCATTDGPPQVTCEGGAIPVGADIWYTYRPPCCGLLTVSTCNSTGIDGTVSVYGGGESCACPIDSSTLLTCGDDTCGSIGGPAVVNLPVLQDACYTIRIAGWNGSKGSGELDLSLTCTPDSAPIDLQPLGHWDVDAGTAADGGAFADVWAEGDIVYLAQVLDNKVHFFDISDPLRPDRFRQWIVASPNTGASAEDVKVGDGLLFVSLWGDGFDGLEIVDVRDPQNPQHLSWVAPLGFGDVRNSFYDGGYLYLATDLSPHFGVVDLTQYDPDDPPSRIDSLLWTVNVGSGAVQDLTVQDGRLYVAARDGGLLIYDVSDIGNQAPAFLGAPPAQPQVNSAWPSEDGRWVVTTEERSGGPVRLYEVLPDGSGVSVTLRDTKTLSALAATSAHNVRVVGRRAYVAWMEAGLRVLDIDELAGRLVDVASYATYYQSPSGPFVGAHGVFPQASLNRLLVADMNTGLHIVELVDQSVQFSYPSGRPEIIHPDFGAPLRIRARSGCDDQGLASVQVFARDSASALGFDALPVSSLGDDLFEVILPGAACGATTEYYVRAETLGGDLVYDPPRAPDDCFKGFVAEAASTLFVDQLETDLGWIASQAICAGVTPTGDWQRVDPNGTLLAPEDDFTSGSGDTCYVTGPAPAGAAYFTADIDGGPFRLTSPEIMTFGQDLRISYARWFYTILFFPGQEDFLVVEVSGDSGATWHEAERVSSKGPQWIRKEFTLSDIMTPASTLRIRFTANDCPNNSISEAAVDDVIVRAINCDACNDFELASNGAGGGRLSRFGCLGSRLPPPAAGGAETGIRVKLKTMYNTTSGDPDGANVCPAVGRTRPSLAQFEGQTRWLGAPTAAVDDALPQPLDYIAAPLVCTAEEAEVRDWSPSALAASFPSADDSRMYFYGSEIVPCSVYEVSQCGDPLDEASCSDPVLVLTSKLGDAWPPFAPAPGQPSFIDIGATVAKFKSLPFTPGDPPTGGPPEWHALVRGNVVGDYDISTARKVDFIDIGKVVESFKTIAYNEQGPCDPSGTDNCGNPCSTAP